LPPDLLGDLFAVMAVRLHAEPGDLLPRRHSQKAD
jgi:hypothetical protein